MNATTFGCSGSSGMMTKDTHRESDVRQMLTSYTEVVEGLSLAVPELRHLVVSHLYDLVALVRGATRDASETGNGRSARAARLDAIKMEIVNCSNRHDLSLAGIAARHGVSPRYMQILFQNEGTTFSRFLLDQRLNRSYRMLSNPRLVPRHSDYDMLNPSITATLAGVSDRRVLRYFERHPVAV
jgi:AraC-like DNA-binding protein